MATPEITGERVEGMQGQSPSGAAEDALNAVKTKTAINLNDDDDRKYVDMSWSSQRRAAARLLNSRPSDFFVGLLVICDLALMMIKVDRRVKCTGKDGQPDADSDECDANALDLVIPEYTLLVFYTLESIARVCVFQKRFYKSTWNIFDLLIVVLSWFQAFVGAIGWNLRYLKLFRVIRAAKIFKLLSEFRELYLLISGFAATIKVVFWATLLLFVLLSMCSIVAVEMIHPVNLRAVEHGRCEQQRCQDAFSSVWQSNLSFFQILILGDSWGAISTPVIEEEPVLALFFIGLALAIFMGYGNLIVGVIVEQAMEARESDKEYQMALQKSMELETKKNLIDVCSSLDADKSGTLTKEELLSSMLAGSKMSHALEQLNIKEQDLEVAFDCLDTDKSGSISYMEFVDQLFDMKNADMRLMLMFMRHDMKQSTDDVLDRFSGMSKVLDNQMGHIQALAKTCGQLWTKTEDLMKPQSPQVTACNDAICTKTGQHSDADENLQSACLPWEATRGSKALSSQSVPAAPLQISSSKAAPPEQPKNQNGDVTIRTEASVFMMPAQPEIASPEIPSPLFPLTIPAARDFQEGKLGFAPVTVTVVSDDAFEQKFMDLRLKVEDKLSVITFDILNRMADKTGAMCKSAELLAQLDTNLGRILLYEGLSTATSEAITTGGKASGGGIAAFQGAVSSTRRSASRSSHQSSSSLGTGPPDAQCVHRGTHLERLCHACAPNSRTAPPVMKV